MRNRGSTQDPKTAAAPATVSGERPSECHWKQFREGGQAQRPASQETSHATETFDRPSGVTGKEMT